MSIATDRLRSWLQGRTTPAPGLLIQAALTLAVLVLAVLALAVLSSKAAWAQAATTADDGSQRVVFEEDFFKDFPALTALDIIDRIPGANIQGTGGNRGLGAQGNVLINGARIGGKSNDGRDALSRIPAASVLKVELIRGVVPSLELRSGGTLINVILREDRKRLSGTWGVEQRIDGTGNYRLAGEGTLRYDGKALEALIGLDVAGFGEEQTGPEAVFDGAGNAVERRDEIFTDTGDFAEISANLDFKLSGGRDLQINAQISRVDQDLREISNRFDATAGLLNEDREFLAAATEYSGEVSIDFTTPLGNALKLRSILVQSLEDEDEDTDSLVLPSIGAATRDFTRILEQEGESIIRNTVTWRVNPKHTLRFGLEGAYNFLDTETDVFIDIGDGAGLREIALSNSTTRVEEWRGDLSVTHTWLLRPDITVDTLLAGETSEISQSGDTEQTRRFTFFKPELTITKRWGETDQLRIQLRRRVLQLSFRDFVSNVNLLDQTDDTGNPDIVPQRQTRAQLTWERRWPGDVARLRLRPFYVWVDDLVDRIPVGLTDDTNGNIASAERYGIELESDLRLDFAGIKGGLASFEIEVGDSRVDDPLTGESREFSDRSNIRYVGEFRQDLNNIGFSWGFDVQNFSESRLFETNEISRFSSSPTFNAFVEWASPWGLTFEARMRNVTENTDRRERTIFASNRIDGDIDSIERSERTNGRVIFFNVRSTF